MPVNAMTVLVVLAAGIIAAVAVMLFLFYRSSRPPTEREGELGVSYLIKERGSKRGMSLFLRLVESRRDHGMVVTRTFPETFQKNGAFGSVSIWWLSGEERPDSIDPLSLAKLTHIVNEFIMKKEDAVILIDGLEYLILQNGFETALRFLQALNDLVILHRATLIIPVDPSSLSVKQLSLLEKELEVHRLAISVTQFFGD